MGASIEEDYLFELLSWTPAQPHIHAQARPAIARRIGFSRAWERCIYVSTSCSVAFATCSWISHHKLMISLWRCIRNRQWWCGRIYSSSKRFKIKLFLVQSLLLVLSSLCVCIGTDTGVSGTSPYLLPLVLALASLVARPCVGQLTLAENCNGRNVLNADRLSINPSS